MLRRWRVKWPSFMKSASAAWVSSGANWPVTLSAETMQSRIGSGTTRKPSRIAGNRTLAKVPT